MSHTRFISLSAVLAAILTGLAPAQMPAVRITEVAASNASGITDAAGSRPDWIELHNPGASPVDLGGYRLTDDPELPAKYVIPPGESIPPAGYRIVFASAHPAYPAGYKDAAGNLHANFALNAAGGYLALRHASGTLLQEFAPALPEMRPDVSWGEASSTPPVGVTVVATGAAGRWLVPSADPGTAWRGMGYDDSAWNAAQTGIGFGSDYLPGAGGDTRNAMWLQRPSALLRVPFSVGSPQAITRMSLRMKFDDGFAAFINGHPVASVHAPDRLAWDSTATAEHPNTSAAVFRTMEFSVPQGLLQAGGNVLAVQGMNFSVAGTNSSDFYLLPELDAITTGPPVMAYFLQPTPGAANTTPGVSGFVADTTFSVDRGWKTEPFSLVITTATPGAEIRYTMDGSPPSRTNGTVYTGPVGISGPATVRAMAWKEGLASTNVDTHTYLFQTGVLRQPSNPAGYPSTWAGRAADYEMDPQVVQNPAYSQTFTDAFAALPALSLVFHRDAFFHPSTGIYQNPLSEGDAWERPVSVEYFTAGGTGPEFQIDGGARIQGGSSRNPDTPKHSLSLRFRTGYGAGKLSHPLYQNTPFGDGAVREFDYLQLRPEYNFGWMHRHYYQCQYAQYGRDQFASDLYLAMGRQGMRGQWVHLFLNGIYWGLYDLHERPDADYMAAYFGGIAADYDCINSAVATNGDLVAFNAMMDLAYGTISTAATYAQLRQYLDVDAFIDYMLLNAWLGNRDWDSHNWRACRRRRVPGAGFLFFPWDSEFAISHVAGGAFNPPPAFESTTLNTNVLTKNTNRNPTGLHLRLEQNAEYRLRYADRVRKHLFDDGPLTSARSAAIWQARSGAITQAVVAESARWGDFRRDVDPGQWASSQFALYTRNDHFLPARQWILNTYLPQRPAIVLAQLRARNLYPATAAPDFSHRGGQVDAGHQLRITGPGTLYYTTDGSDPRLAGGNVALSALTIASGGTVTLNTTGSIKSRARSAGGEWSALTEASFAIGTGQLRLTEIMYRPAGNPLAEFLEITNTGTAAVSLAGLRFTEGVDFDFDTHSSIGSLDPGGRLLIVRDRAAFESVYGTSLNARIAGTFQNLTALANGGETLTLTDSTGTVVFSVSYRDAFPWPREADGGGYSLVFTGAAPDDALNWRRSLTPGGNPAASDALTPGGDPLTVLQPRLECELHPETSPPHLLVRARVRLGADHWVKGFEFSPDLRQWTPPANAPVLISRRTEDGDEWLTWQVDLPAAPPGRLFLRMTVTGR